MKYIIDDEELIMWETDLDAIDGEWGSGCGRGTDEHTIKQVNIINKIRSTPYQSERVLDEKKIFLGKIAKRLRQEFGQDDNEEYYLCAEDFENVLDELNQEITGDPQYQCGDNCKGECSGEVDGFVHCPYNPQVERDTLSELKILRNIFVLQKESEEEHDKEVREKVLEDIETVIDKTTSYVSRYELERKIAEHRQGQPQYQCGDNCKGECSGEVDGVVHCPYQSEMDTVLKQLHNWYNHFGNAMALEDERCINVLDSLRQSKDGEQS